MEPVGELDQDDPDVLGHRQQHLPDVLGLLLLVAVGAELGQLRHAVDELGDLGPELLLDVGQAELGVLGDVVEQRRLDGDRVDAELGQDLGRGDRMRDVRLAGRAALALVGGDGQVERLADRSQVGRGVLLEDGRVEIGPQGVEVDPDAGRLRAQQPARGAARAGTSSCSAVFLVPGVVVAIGSRIPSAEPGPAQRGLGLGTLVPGLRAVGADDRLLVALAGEQHDVARPGALEGRLDGGPAVGDDQQVVVASPAGGFGATRRSRRGSPGDPRRAGPRRSRTTIRARSPAMRPICGRLAVSRSPADPKTTMSPPPRDAADGASRSSTVRSDAGLWAKSTMTPYGWPSSIRSIRPGTTGTLPRPSRTAAGSSPTASPRATTARALWTLKRPTRRRSTVALPDGAS